MKRAMLALTISSVHIMLPVVATSISFAADIIIFKAHHEGVQCTQTQAGHIHKRDCNLPMSNSYVYELGPTGNPIDAETHYKFIIESKEGDAYVKTYDKKGIDGKIADSKEHANQAVEGEARERKRADDNINRRITDEVMTEIADLPKELLTEELKEELRAGVLDRLEPMLASMRKEITRDVLCELADSNPSLGISC